MVRIRLRRVGMKGQPSYRIVAADKESPRDGRFLEILGFYNPRTEPATIQVKEDRIYHWMSNGAQPSDSVKQIFTTAGVLDRYARFKAGEALETLLAESEKMMAERNINPKTRRD
ncbi:MAG: 30S ribosomal protein S16 [Chloroflexi bacterium]|nr:30S ribosomal protein S16 [Chloroflexota bacterium]